MKTLRAMEPLGRLLAYALSAMAVVALFMFGTFYALERIDALQFPYSIVGFIAYAVAVVAVLLGIARGFEERGSAQDRKRDRSQGIQG
jgi:hypothetical protein